MCYHYTSDTWYPVEDSNPYLGLRTPLTHPERTGLVWYPLPDSNRHCLSEGQVACH